MTDYSFKTYGMRNKSPGKSIYQDNFPSHDLTASKEQESHFAENKQRLRQSNYTLGTQGNHFQSSYGAQMLPPGDKAQPVKGTRSMRQSNVMLGNDHQVNISENQQHFDYKEKTDHYVIDKANKKQHSHRFGDESNQFQSMNQRFLGAKDHQVTPSLHADMRKSNIALGFRKEEQGGQYGENCTLNLDHNHITNAARLTNMHLGDNNTEYRTGFSQAQFNKGDQPEYNNVSTGRMLKVREANFILGNAKQAGVSENHGQYPSHPVQSQPVPANDFRATNYTLDCRVEPGQDQHSSYVQQFSQGNTKSAQQRQNEMDQLKSENLRKRQANFILGYDHQMHQSEKAGQYDDKQAGTQRQAPFRPRRENTKLGTDPFEPLPCSKEQYGDKTKEFQRQSLSPERLKSMRSNNFENGFVRDSYKITPQSTLIGQQVGHYHQDHSDMQRIQHKLKGGNFHIATEDKNYYTTMYSSMGK